MMKISKLRPFLIVTIVVISSVSAISFSTSLATGTSNVIGDEFVLTFIGLFAGLAVAVIALVFSIIENVMRQLTENCVDVKKYSSVIRRIYSEMRENTIMIIIVLALCFLMIVIREIDFMKAHICFVEPIVSVFKLSGMILTIISVKDIFTALFNLIKANHEF
jgi:hypothetical protein